MNELVKKIATPVTYLAAIAGLAYAIHSCDLSKKQLSEPKHELVVLKNKQHEKFIGYDGGLDGMFVRRNLEDDYVKQMYINLDADSTTVEEIIEMQDTDKPYRTHLVAEGFKPSRDTGIDKLMTKAQYDSLNNTYKSLLKYHECIRR